MKRWMKTLAVVTMMMSGGCRQIVLDPLDSPPGPAPTNALAMRASDFTIPPGINDEASTASFLFSFTLDPDSLVLFLSDSTQQCSEPLIRTSRNDGSNMPVSSPNAPFWQVILVIPPELNRPGLIDLRDTRILIYEAYRGLQGEVGSQSSNGQHPYITGPLEIHSSDATSLSLSLHEGNPLPGAGSAGLPSEYTAARCGAALPVSPPLPALAIPGSSLPAPPGGGPTPDPGAVHLFFEPMRFGAVTPTTTATCAEPEPPVDCPRRATLSLPPSLQKPGILDLTDPAIAASFVVAGGVLAAGVCEDGMVTSGVFDGGTIEILSIDASGVSFKVYGSHTSLASNSFDGDGLYAASMCP